jgi:RNA polymerase sigma-70 factor (ECF subfamily)
MHDEPTDAELVERFRRAEDREESFRLLVFRHTPRLLGFLRAYFRDRAEAEDILQDVFLTLYRSLPEWTAGARLDLWLLKAARNRALNEKRRRRTHPTASEASERESEGPREAGGATLELQKAIQALPENYREILILHRFKGLRYSEIASLLGTTAGSARVLMHKALELLRKNLSESD